jgi:hypothetical protein
MSMTSIAEIRSEWAGIYLQQLCKHFSNKIELNFTPKRGTIKFPFGDCQLAAEDGVLTLSASAADIDTLQKLESVMGSHLERFAFREKPKIRCGREPA